MTITEEQLKRQKQKKIFIIAFNICVFFIFPLLLYLTAFHGVFEFNRLMPIMCVLIGILTVWIWVLNIQCIKNKERMTGFVTGVFLLVCLGIMIYYTVSFWGLVIVP